MGIIIIISGLLTEANSLNKPIIIVFIFIYICHNTNGHKPIIIVFIFIYICHNTNGHKLIIIVFIFIYICHNTNGHKRLQRGEVLHVYTTCTHSHVIISVLVHLNVMMYCITGTVVG